MERRIMDSLEENTFMKAFEYSVMNNRVHERFTEEGKSTIYSISEGEIYE